MLKTILNSTNWFDRLLYLWEWVEQISGPLFTKKILDHISTLKHLNKIGFAT